MPQITGGIALHPKTGRPIIELSDDDMQTIQRMQRSGFGQSELPSGAIELLARQRRSASRGIGQMTRGERYEHWRDTAKLYLNGGGGDPEIREAIARDQEAMVQKFVSPGDVHSDAFLTNVAVKYANDEYIGMDLCPDVLVPKQTGIIPSWDKRDRLAAPDDALNDYDMANEIHEHRDGTAYICKGRGLSNSVPATTLANQDAPYNELLDLTESVSELMALRREIRCGTLLTTAANYGANTKAIPAADRWDTAGGGDPIKDMQDADAALWTGRGPSDKVMFSSLSVYNVLSRHPDILSLFRYGGSAPGLATPDMIARFLSAARFLVGRARHDTANEGKTASYARIWSDVFGLVRVPRGGATLMNAWFAATLRWNMTPAPPGTNPQMGYITQQWYDQKVGIGGAYWAKVATAEVQQVIASDTGYLYTTPIG